MSSAREQLLDARGDDALQGSSGAAEVLDVLARGQALVQAARIRQHAEPRAYACRVRRSIEAVDEHAPAVRPHQRVEHAQRRGLARAVRTEQAGDLAVAAAKLTPFTACSGTPRIVKDLCRSCTSIIGGLAAGFDASWLPAVGTRERRRLDQALETARIERARIRRVDELRDQPRHATRHHHVVSLAARDQVPAVRQGRAGPARRSAAASPGRAPPRAEEPVDRSRSAHENPRASARAARPRMRP